jgi:hypothetical protein
LNFYDQFVSLYDRFLSLVPVQLQWLMTLLVVVGLVAAFINLIKANWLFLILLILLVPAISPVLQHFFGDLYNFFLYLLTTLNIKH